MEKSADTASSTWNKMLPETEEIYARWKAAATRNDGWTEVARNTNRDSGAAARHLFSGVATENGPVILYIMFVHEREKQLRGLCQFGVEAQGPLLFGSAHGGAIATMHDSISGILTRASLKQRTLTASLTINYKRPIPLRSLVLMEASIDKIEGKKIFSKSRLKSPDGATVYSEATCLFVLMGKASL